MNKLKQQFLEIKKNTPKHVQWLLLVAAFIVVSIMLLLLIGGKDEKNDLGAAERVASELKISPDSVAIKDIEVGTEKSETVTLTANLPVKIVDVSTTEISGLTVSDTCTKMGQIDSELSCTILVKYAPTAAQKIETAKITVKWHDAEQSEDMTRTSEIDVKLSAKAAATPAPVADENPFVAEEETQEEEIVEQNETETPEEVEEEPAPVPVKEEIKQEIEQIAPSVSFEPESKPLPTITETCSDFAFPGYDNSGNQIGWIKPEGGAYKFHPFSDTECNNPTGIYNPDTGLIMSISDKGKRIGSDADHVGYNVISSGAVPQLSNAPEPVVRNRARQLSTEELDRKGKAGRLGADGMTAFSSGIVKRETDVKYESTGDVVVSSEIHDRQFLLRQYKPIPATIVSDVRADPEALANAFLPVRATVDRNVYSDNGRNVIIPTGTLLMGYVTGDLPGPYTTIGRMNIKWYQFILPNGVEFNFKDGEDPFSGDAQGRTGIPGYGSTDYLEQFFMPMLTALVPAAVNLIAPISDKFVNQIDLDNNTVVQSGTMRSSEMAKNEIITAWNQVAQKILVDMMDNTVPPFTIAAGTRITVYSPVDLMVTCGDPEGVNKGKKCAVAEYGTEKRRKGWKHSTDRADDGSWVGQVRSFNISKHCIEENGKKTANPDCATGECDGYDYRTILLYCESLNYTSKSKIKQEAYHESEVKKYQDTYGTEGNRDEEQTAAYEEMVGIVRDEDGYVVNPYEQQPAADAGLTCEDGTPPDANGCCTGEIYTDMGDQGFNCCPSTGGDCFPPLL